jgi:hypothetical protein
VESLARADKKQNDKRKMKVMCLLEKAGFLKLEWGMSIAGLRAMV